MVFAPLTTLAIGLFFIFVWAPHPWGWRGIDQYDALAKELALGKPFSTTDVPWGYTYYLAICFRLFGEHTWVPVVGQAIINAAAPLLLFLLARPAVGQRIASLAAWLTAILSFNTVYASTQSSDAICTVLFLLAVLWFVRGHKRSSAVAFAVAGVLSGVVPQFRPNMILLPVMVAAAYAVWAPRSLRRLAHSAVFLAAMVAVLMPWVVRNYRFTGTILPTSTHGGIQLWYGTLQTGEHLESKAHNPRAAFASPAFPYTSMNETIVITAASACERDLPSRLAFRTSRDANWRWIDGVKTPGGPDRFELPAQALPTVVHYYLEAGGETSPPGGAAEPLIYYVSDNHLGDLDTAGEMLDFFDIARLSRQVAGLDAPAVDRGADINLDGRIDTADLAAAVALQLPEVRDRAALLGVERDGDLAVLRLADGSSIGVPPGMTKQSDVFVNGELATTLVSRYRTMASIRSPRPRCVAMEEIAVNQVFYRREPHEMRRYTALAFDNINRDPLAFVAASAYRLVRLFIIRGTDDRMTTFQFPLSRVIFQAGMVASLLYFVAFLAGVVIAWRARSPFLYALIPIAYVPLTICFVLTNMRYTITVQPLMFVFVAMTVAAVFKLGTPAAATSRT